MKALIVLVILAIFATLAVWAIVRGEKSAAIHLPLALIVALLAVAPAPI